MKKAVHLLHALPFLLLLLSASILHAQPTMAPRRGDGVAEERSLVFTENRGQIVDTRGRPRPEILYLAEAHAFRIYLTGSGVHYLFDRIEEVDRQSPHADPKDPEEASHLVTGRYRMDMELVGANPSATVVPGDPAEGVSNFYLAHASDGINGVRSWRELVYRDIYPHIDMTMRVLDGKLKCDFVVHPGGDPSLIRMKYSAADALEITPEGALRAMTPLGDVTEEAPFTYIDNRQSDRPIVASRYRIDGDVVSFDLAAYDRTQTLVIDPIRKWSTFYGGNGNENLSGGDPTEVDRNGNVLVAGFVDNNAFPVSTGAVQGSYGGGFRDAILVKFDGNGRRLWATYYGGSQDEIAHGVVSDAARNVYLAGHTTSSNFPVQNAYQGSNGGGRDAFIVKLDSNGGRLWATYYGGDDFDDGYGFGGDSTGNVAVLLTSGSAGLATDSTFQPIKPSAVGNLDALVVKFTSAGGRVWGTYYGGNNTEYGYAMGTDPSDNIIISGWTFSTNFPTTGGAFQTVNNGSSDAFIVKFNRSGVRQWATYYGGNGTEDDAAGQTIGFAGLATDGGGNIFITGFTTGGTFPTTTGSFQPAYGGGVSDAFIVKMNPNGVRVWATFVGGSGEDVGTGIASNPDGGVLGTGFTGSTNFPVTTDAYQRTLAGANDAYIMKLSRVGAREWGTYYGGTANDEGHGISFDPYGSLVVAGHTSSTNFPTLNPYQSTKGGGGGPDAFALLFCDPSKPRVDSLGTHNFCAGDSLVLWAIPGYSSYRWSNGASTDTIVIKSDGDYFLTVTSVSGCIATSDTIRARVRPRRRPVINPAGPYRLCQGDTITLDAGVALSYRWSTGATTQKIKVNTAGDFKVYTVDINGCRDSSEIMSVAIFPKPDTIHITPRGPIVFCEGDSVRLTANTTSSPVVWSTGETAKSIVVTRSGTYRAVIDNPAFCYRIANEVVVKVNPKPRPTITASGNTTICEGDSVTLTAPNGYVSYSWSNGKTSKSITVRTIGNYVLTVTDTNGCVGTSSELVNVTARPVPKIFAVGDTTFCEGDSVQLVAETGYPVYKWSNGAVGRTTYVKEAGTYTVQAGSDGCLGTSNAINVTITPRPVSVPDGPDTVCPNTRNTYSVPAVAGGKYVWSVTAPATIVSGQGTNQIVVNFTTVGTRVSVSVEDPTTGCNGSGSLLVGIGTTLNPRITSSRANRRICPGDSLILSAGTYTSYTWTKSGSPAVIGTGQTLVVRDAGTYSLSVSNGGCSGGPVSITIDLSPAPAPVIGGGTQQVLCPGASLVLDAGPFTSYLWSNNARTRTITVTQPGTYWIQVTNSAGCTTKSASVNVVAGVAPTPAVTGAASVCGGSRTTYCTAETPGNIYRWEVAGGTIVVGDSTTPCITVEWGTGTNGSVKLVEKAAAGGCTASSASFLVAITSGISPTIGADGPTTFCFGDSVTLSGPPGFDRYEWSNGETTRSIVADRSGSYRLNVFAGAGCSGSATVDVTVYPEIDAAVAPAGPIRICEGESVTLSARAGYPSYRWSNGASTPSIDVNTTGQYTVTISDQNGCEVTSQIVDVVVNKLPAAPSISRRGDTLTSTPAARYQWLLDSVPIPGGTSQSFVATSQGEYRVRITDENGCSSISPAEPGVNAASLVMLPVIEATPGERLTIPLSLVSSRNLDNVGASNFTLTLRFNKTLLLPTGGMPLGTIDGGTRVVTITGRRADGIATGTFATLDFIAALGDTLATPLQIESFEWIDGSVRVEKMNGEVRIKPNGGWQLYIPDGQLTLLPPQPNPVANTSEVELVYETIEPGRTELYIVDMLGRRATTIVDAELTPTRYSTRIDVRDLASGTYFIILQTPTERLVQPLQIEK
jgi:hypothetical protein